MGFVSGSVSFSRFQVLGGGPKRLDDNLLDKLRENLAGKHALVQANNEEAGWLGGRHLFDREFDLEKNILLDCLHFGLRIDAAKVPPDILRAYVQMELDALRGAGGDGPPNAKILGKMKKQATEAAKRRADEEVKQGRYARMRQFPMVLDTRNDVLFSAATQPAVHERLHPLFKNTFGKRLEPKTAGFLAFEWAEANNTMRKFESAKPTPFVTHPHNDPDPGIYWTAHDPTCRDFLGNEFLLWLWHHLSEVGDTIELPDKTDATAMIVKQLMLECPWGESGKEVISSDGPTELPESKRAIKSGKLPRKAGLIVVRQGEQYEFALQAETWNVSGGNLPKPENMGGGRERIEERIEQIRHLCDTIDQMYFAFLKIRLSSNWQETADRISGWLRKN